VLSVVAVRETVDVDEVHHGLTGLCCFTTHAHAIGQGFQQELLVL